MCFDHAHYFYNYYDCYINEYFSDNLLFILLNIYM